MKRWDTWADALGIDIHAELRRAPRGMPVRPVREIVKKVLETEGRTGLVKRSCRQGNNTWKRMTPATRAQRALTGATSEASAVQCTD